MRSVENAECRKCGVWKMRSVENAECIFFERAFLVRTIFCTYQNFCKRNETSKIRSTNFGGCKNFVRRENHFFLDIHLSLGHWYPAPGQPSVAAHQIQLGPLYPALYNPPSFPIHVARFHHPYTSPFQAHSQNVPSQAAPLHRPFSSFQPSAAAGSWHLGLSPHSYYLVALPTIVKKCYGCGDTCLQKNFVSHHTTSWSSTWIGVWCAGTTTQGR